MNKIAYLLCAFCLLQGCAGARYSYKSLIEDEGDASVLRLTTGERVEVLVVGNGFPGWWGMYPGVISSASDIASIDCEDARSAVPFREPGMLFGGEVCMVSAHKKGAATLYFGNKFTLTTDSYNEKYDVIIVDN
ncbi:hypothetical protein [Spongiibacter marinus]|uniref:hypothetical protein n=1 Tax=Spongiibacter marinus TaxID=354246 RepID=UPI0004076B0C|nr:hypothetical protein [Spongiibacter marinus]